MDESERFRSGTHVCKPFRYRSGKSKPKKAPRKAVVLGLQCALRAEPDPQGVAFRLTGIYESNDGTLTMCLNHAGNYLALWISRTESADVVHLVGRAETQPNFLVFRPEVALEDLPKTVGALGLGSSADEVVLHLEAELRVGLIPFSGSIAFARVSKRKTLSDRALDSLPGGSGGSSLPEVEMIRVTHHSPIPSADAGTIERVLREDRFTQLIETFLSEDIGPGINAGASKAVKELCDFLEAELGTIRGWRAGAPLSSAYAQLAQNVLLTSDKISVKRSPSIAARLYGAKLSKEDRTPFSWLVDIVAIVEHELIAKPDITWLTSPNHLGIPSAKGAPSYVYEFDFDGEGLAADAGIGVQAFTGVLKVRQVEPTRAEKPWTFVALLAGFSVGLSGGFQVGKRLQGVGRSVLPWTEVDFLTGFSVLEVGVQASYVAGGSVGPTAWVLSPPPGRARMTVTFDAVAMHGMGGGAEFGPSRGYIRSEGKSFGDIVEEAATLETVRYEARYGGGTTAHFELGSALLSRYGKRLLGHLGAAELDLLSRPTSQLELVGSADRVDVEWYNELLSTVRAENALTALRDALGPELEAKAFASGLGETLPKDAGLKDGQEAAEFRRVFVEYQGRPIANLQVARK